jgi:RNA polymerase sigma-70 factor (ECF subfamily)
MPVDRSRFETKALPLQRDLYFAAMTLAKNESDALDLVQETYLRAFRSFATYRDDQNFRGWMLTILRNAWLDHCRRRTLAPALVPPEADALPAPAMAPAGSLEEALPDDILRALKSLTPAHQLILLLVDIERLSYQETADVLGVPIGSVMSGLHNARVRLRDAVAAAKPPSPATPS